jgi:hypothetical protein
MSLSDRKAALGAMRTMALHRRALDDGLDEEAVSACMDRDAPKAALVELILAAEAQTQVQPEPEPERDSAGMVGRIVAAIAGDKSQRETAYVSLTCIAHGDNEEVAATVASASVHVSGAELENEGKLAELFGKFGTVLAATLRREGNASWALMTFDEAESAQAAVAGAAKSLGVSGLAVRALDTQEALGEAGLLGEVMREHRQRVSVGVAGAAVGPLVETVLTKDISVIDAAEFRRASSVLCEIAMLDPLELCAEYFRNERFTLVWSSMGNAYNAVFKKDPSQLTREDALTASVDSAFKGIYTGRGFDACTGPAGVNIIEWVVALSTHAKHSPGVSSEVLMKRLCEILLGIVRDPRGISELELAGVWQMLGDSFSGRQALAVPLIEAGLLEAGV